MQKAHPTGCQLVNVGRDLSGRTTKTTRSVPVHVISDDQQDVRSLNGSGKLGLDLANQKDAEDNNQSFLHEKRALNFVLSQDLQGDVLEVDEHSRVMQLKLDHATLEAFLLGQVLGELGGRLAVDRELERVALDHHVDGIPVVLIDGVLGHSPLDLGQGRLVIFVYHQAFAAEAAVFPATWGVKVPSPEHLRPDTKMSDIRVIALKTALARRIDDGPDANPAVAPAGKTIVKLQL